MFYARNSANFSRVMSSQGRDGGRPDFVGHVIQLAPCEMGLIAESISSSGTGARHLEIYIEEKFPCSRASR